MMSERNRGSQAGAGTHRLCSQYGPCTQPSPPCPLGLSAEIQDSRLGHILSAAKNLYPGGCLNLELQRLLGIIQSDPFISQTKLLGSGERKESVLCHWEGQ